MFPFDRGRGDARRRIMPLKLSSPWVAPMCRVQDSYAQNRAAERDWCRSGASCSSPQASDFRTQVRCSVSLQRHSYAKHLAIAH